MEYKNKNKTNESTNNKNNKRQKFIEAETRSVSQRGRGWREHETGKGDQLCGDEWRLDFGGECDVVHTDMNYNVASLKLI